MLTEITYQPAYILHSRAYRDTSLLLDIYTQETGRISAIAKGAKRGKRTLSGLLQPFVPLSLSAKGRTDILTMTAVEARGMPLQLHGARQIAGFYINELMVRLVGRFESSPVLFNAYQIVLEALQTQPIEIPLRLFERRLIEALGYGLSFDQTLPDSQSIVPDKNYIFVAEQGFKITKQSPNFTGVFAGSTILSIAQEEYSCDETLLAAKHLFRQVLQVHLGKKPLMSRQLWVKEGS